jgi:uncharacterized protein YdeI (YjbR/CyaY-like superfamily)
MNPKVDAYFVDGCGRCPLGGTPQCKVNNWREPLETLRSIVLESGLTEELKWHVPCYTFQGTNVLLLGAFKENCVISFLNGALLKDAKKVLEKPGENSQAGRIIRFTNVQEVLKLKPTIKAYIREAIQNEKSGLKVNLSAKTELVLPEEFQAMLKKNPALKKAFQSLTPGKQRAYNLYFSAPKQSQTREARIQKCIPKILNGEAIDEEYRKRRSVKS